VLIQVFRADISFKSEHSYDLVMPFRRPDRSWWGLFPLRTASPFYTPHGSLLEDKECDGAFANAGTHQVPLFNGLPPPEIIESSDPLESLLRKLKQQTSDLPSHAFSCCSSGSTSGSTSGSCSATLGRNLCTTAAGDNDDGDDHVVLSESGASAIIRIQERSLWRFIPEHIKVNGLLLPNTNILSQILGTQLAPHQQHRLFRYDPLKHLSETPMKVMIPSRFAEESFLLTDAMSIKLQQDIQEEIDSTPLP
jgi:hypothetical protein